MRATSSYQEDFAACVKLWEKVGDEGIEKMVARMMEGLGIDVNELNGMSPDEMSGYIALRAAGAVRRNNCVRPRQVVDAMVAMEMECCGNCGKNKCDNVALMRCGACHTTLYCDVECQRAHWKTHKPLCKKA